MPRTFRTTPPATRTGRLRAQDIVTRMRQDVLSGRCAPGSLLPPRVELIARFGSTSATVQRAIDILRSQGFVRTNGARGTRVTERPPHLYEYAMVFRDGAQGAFRNRLYQMLVGEAARYNGSDEEPRRIRVYCGVENHVDSPGLNALVAALRAQSLAGVIAPENPQATGLAQTALGEYPALPRVTLTGSHQDTGRRWGHVAFGPWYERGLDTLRECGRQRIAVLSGYPSPAGLEDELGRLIAVRGLETRPYWLLRAPLDGAECARNIMRLLFSGAAGERPDGLLITNDTLVEDAVAGVVAAGIRVPEHLTIVAHCNFPWQVVSAVPVLRIGYETRDLLAACLEELAAQQQGAAPGTRVVQATFEQGAT